MKGCFERQWPFKNRGITNELRHRLGRESTDLGRAWGRGKGEWHYESRRWWLYRQAGRWKDNDFCLEEAESETSKPDRYMSLEVMRKIKARDRTWRGISIWRELICRCPWDYLDKKWRAGRLQGIGWKLKHWGPIFKRTWVIQACYRTCYWTCPCSPHRKASGKQKQHKLHYNCSNQDAPIKLITQKKHPLSKSVLPRRSKVSGRKLVPRKWPCAVLAWLYQQLPTWSGQLNLRVFSMYKMSSQKVLFKSNTQWVYSDYSTIKLNIQARHTS